MVNTQDAVGLGHRAGRLPQTPRMLPMTEHDSIQSRSFAVTNCHAVDLEALLCAWQSTGSHAALEDLVHAAEPVATLVIGRVLAQRGIRDPAALDDALALVFNHLRRLPGPAVGESAVTSFDPARGTAADHGRAYLQRLAHDRAVDVARRVRRDSRRVASFSALEDAAAAGLEGRLAMQVTSFRGEDDEPPGCVITEVIGQLDPRERELVRLLLEGKSQAVIAHMLGVCDGTVSRLRGRVIVKLRAAIQTRSSADRGETPAPPARAAPPGRVRASRRHGPPGPSAPA
jgi:DNA-directed RNA polymerase specialized sigma24 family protein